MRKDRTHRQIRRTNWQTLIVHLPLNLLHALLGITLSAWYWHHQLEKTLSASNIARQGEAILQNQLAHLLCCVPIKICLFGQLWFVLRISQTLLACKTRWLGCHAHWCPLMTRLAAPFGSTLARRSFLPRGGNGVWETGWGVALVTANLGIVSKSFVNDHSNWGSQGTTWHYWIIMSCITGFTLPKYGPGFRYI